MKKESDKNLKTLKKEFNERMKVRRNEDDNAHSERSEDLEESEGEVDPNNSPEKQQETVRDSMKKPAEAKTTFITEVNITYGKGNESKTSPDLPSGRSITGRNANVMKIKALEKELQDVKKDNRELRKKNWS